jgi:(S)-2-hydroxyglutarate dehydrogenase
VHYAIIGGGIVGLATARALVHAQPEARIVVLEKENTVGRHQSTHNSGVLHAGLHYLPGSTKATLTRMGIRRMTEYCRERGIRHEICGKLVVAVSTDEVPRLHALHERGQKNGLQNLRWLTPAQARELEPHVHCVAALHVPEEGIVDYGAVCRALSEELQQRGVQIRTDSAVLGLHASPAGWIVQTASGDVESGFIINCAGLYSDRVARLAGERPRARIVPFRGEYYVLRAERQHLVRNLIYPVPDPTFPFLGVHFTRRVLGGVEAGPNAVLAFAREGYRNTQVNLRELADALTFPGLWRFLARHPRTVARELAQSFSKERFAQALQRLVPDLHSDDLAPGGAGVRAQTMLPNGDLVHDFEWIERRRALHLLSAPSPAATASLAIGEQIALRVTGH